jgi:hypothetical protein
MNDRSSWGILGVSLWHILANLCYLLELPPLKIRLVNFLNLLLCGNCARFTPRKAVLRCSYLRRFFRIEFAGCRLRSMASVRFFQALVRDSLLTSLIARNLAARVVSASSTSYGSFIPSA